MDTAPALVRNIGTKTILTSISLSVYGVLAMSCRESLNMVLITAVGDLDDDGKPDLLASPEMGTYHSSAARR